MKTFLPWVTLIAVVSLGPTFSAFLLAFWSLLLLPTIHLVGAHSKVSVFAVMVLFNSIGALLIASIISLPIGFAIRNFAWFYGAVAGIAIVSVHLFWLSASASFTWSNWLWAAESITLVLALTVFSQVSSKYWRLRSAA